MTIPFPRPWTAYDLQVSDEWDHVICVIDPDATLPDPDAEALETAVLMLPRAYEALVAVAADAADAGGQLSDATISQVLETIAAFGPAPEDVIVGQFDPEGEVAL